jgi:hypothetical protein
MPWRAPALEDLDDDHAAAAAWTSWLALIDGGRGGLAFRFCSGEQLAHAGDGIGASAFGGRRRICPANERKAYCNRDGAELCEGERYIRAFQVMWDMRPSLLGSPD